MLSLVLYALAIWVLARHKNYLVALFAVLVPVVSVLINTGLKCHSEPSSEACVWGVSLLSLTIGIAVSLGTPLLYLVLTGFTSIMARLQGTK